MKIIDEATLTLKDHVPFLGPTPPEDESTPRKIMITYTFEDSAVKMSFRQHNRTYTIEIPSRTAAAVGLIAEGDR